MNFASDNWAGAHPAIAAALVENASGYAAAYGTSQLDRKLEQRFGEIFEREVTVYFVATGTAANALSMTALSRPGGVAFMHREAHMLGDECGAVEYLSGGGRLSPVKGEGGRIDPAALESALERYPAGFVHAGRPVAVSVTQATEIGTLYALEQIDRIAAICRRHGLKLHMDGARFANALAALGCTPAEMSWKRGVDILSFGGTKNGCWCAEAILVFDPAIAADMPFLRKRAGQLFSKSRFVAAQFEAYFADGLWLANARHANAMAARLAGHIRNSSRARLAWEAETNEVFPVLPLALVEELKAQDATFHPWSPADAGSRAWDRDEVLVRLVTSFATTEAEVDRFGALIA